MAPRCATTAATKGVVDVRLEWDNGALKLIAPRVVAGPPSAEAIELAQLLSRMPDPYASDLELVDAFVDGLLAGVA